MASLERSIECVESVGEKLIAILGKPELRSYSLRALCDDEEIALIIEGPEWGHILLYFSLPCQVDAEGIGRFASLRILGETRDISQLGIIQEKVKAWL